MVKGATPTGLLGSAIVIEGALLGSAIVIEGAFLGSAIVIEGAAETTIALPRSPVGVYLTWVRGGGGGLYPT